MFNWATKYIEESKKLSGIAGPLILSSFVSMGVSIIDLVMMSWIGPKALAAGAIVSDYYSVFFYFFVGIIASSTALLSHAVGAQNIIAIKKIIHNAVLVAVIGGVLGLLILRNTDSALQLLRIENQLVILGQPYAQIMGYTFFAMLGVNLIHYFLSAHGKTRIIFYASIFALPLNALGNYVLMFGKLGFPEMGLAGAGWSSFFAATVMFSVLFSYLIFHGYTRKYSIFSKLSFDLNTTKDIFRIGLPIGVSSLGEMGVFLLVTVLMGRFGAEAVAAHIVALRIAGVIYAIPLGYAQAATVRIGTAIGSMQFEQIRIVFISSLSIAVGFGILYLSMIGLYRQEISMLFLDSDKATQDMLVQTALFLLLLAIAQPFDCLGAVGSGILRGFKDTRSIMYYSIVGFWGVSFVGGNTLAFHYGLQGTGLWLGLAGGSIVFGLLILNRLLSYWRNHTFELMPSTVSG